jgi:hypothetical protein
MGLVDLEVLENPMDLGNLVVLVDLVDQKDQVAQVDQMDH